MWTRSCVLSEVKYFSPIFPPSPSPLTSSTFFSSSLLFFFSGKFPASLPHNSLFFWSYSPGGVLKANCTQSSKKEEEALKDIRGTLNFNCLYSSLPKQGRGGRGEELLCCFVLSFSGSPHSLIRPTPLPQHSANRPNSSPETSVAIYG